MCEWGETQQTRTVFKSEDGAQQCAGKADDQLLSGKYRLVVLVRKGVYQRSLTALLFTCRLALLVELPCKRDEQVIVLGKDYLK